jgi:hypothetical protein
MAMPLQQNITWIGVWQVPMKIKRLDWVVVSDSLYG